RARRRGRATCHTWRAASPRLRTGCFALVVVVGGATLAVALFAGLGALEHPIVYHADRGTEIESLYGNVQLVLGWLPGLTPLTHFSPEDLSRVVSSSLDGIMVVAPPVVLGLFLLLTYASLWRATLRMGAPQAAATGGAGQGATARSAAQLLLVAITAVLLAFTLAFRALPAHYLLDILPLAVVIRLPRGWRQRLWLGALVTVALGGQALTVVWPALVALRPAAVALLSIRNMAWMLALGLLLVALWQWPRATASRRAGDGARATRRTETPAPPDKAASRWRVQ
ncbi:MAG: hypothetical protein ACHQ4H_09200, partial [Ktedonobacterales bacterium]